MVKLIKAILAWESPPGMEQAGLDNPIDNFLQALEYLDKPESQEIMTPEIDLCKQVMNNTVLDLKRFLFWPYAMATSTGSISNGVLLGPAGPIWNVVYKDTQNGERWGHNVTGWSTTFFSRLERAAHRRVVTYDLTNGIEYPHEQLDFRYYPGLRCPFNITRSLCPSGHDHDCPKVFRLDLQEAPPDPCAFVNMLRDDFGQSFCQMIGF